MQQDPDALGENLEPTGAEGEIVRSRDLVRIPRRAGRLWPPGSTKSLTNDRSEERCRLSTTMCEAVDKYNEEKYLGQRPRSLDAWQESIRTAVVLTYIEENIRTPEGWATVGIPGAIQGTAADEVAAEKYIRARNLLLVFWV